MSTMDRFRLDGKTALVTGAGRGIGKAIAVAFAEAGANVVCAARTTQQIEATAEAIEQAGGNALPVTSNVADEDSRRQLVQAAAEAFGHIDILINNAGGSAPNDPMKTSAENFSKSLHWNVVPAYDLTRLCVPSMMEAGAGSIVNISSAAARLRQRGFSAYGTAKAALTHMTRLLAQDFAPAVRINAIEPGPIMTEALRQYMSQEQQDFMASKTPLQKLGTTQDVAAAALFLASPASQWITGKVLELDGGVEGPLA